MSIPASEHSLNFVLVHGAWHGGWCWKRVSPLLRVLGHEVFTPTLTGLGERQHLMSPEVGLDTHIKDVARSARVQRSARRHSGWPQLCGNGDRGRSRVGPASSRSLFSFLDVINSSSPPTL